MADFLLTLSYETWECFCWQWCEQDFQLLKYIPYDFYSSFPLIQVDNVGNNNS